MKVREMEKSGSFLVLKIDGKTREFFIVSEIKNYSSFSSSLVNAGQCVSYTARLREVVETKFDSYGSQIVTGYEKYEYFKGYAGLDYVVDFKELEEPAKKRGIFADEFKI